MKRLISILILAVLVSACRDDIFDRDLSSTDVVILIPQDNLQTTVNNVHFKWEEIEGATGYHLQVVSPTFASILVYELDSVITGTEFFHTLVPGDYQWRIRVENNSSEGPWSPIRNLTIDSTNDLSLQTITLATPTDADYINSTLPTLTWLSLPSADSYNILVKTGTDWVTGTTVETGNTTSTSYTMTNTLSEGEYIWGIQAINATSSSAYFTNTVTVDLTVPDQPTALTPNSSSSLAAGVGFTFTWSRAVDNGSAPSPLADSVFVYTDVGLTTLYKRFTTTNQSYTDSIPTAGTYYWNVKTFDEAGNIGTVSTALDFTIP